MPFYCWVTDTQFGSGIAKAIARRIDASAGGSQAWPLDYDEMAGDLEFTVAEIRHAVALMLVNGHARIEHNSPGLEGTWLLLLTPERVAEDAAKIQSERAKAETRAAKIALRGGRVSRAAIPDELKSAVFERDQNACRKCGTTSDLTLDHVYPWSIGGPDTAENLQTLCRPCNSRKGDRA
jgi:hypothetical protein